MHVRRFAGIDCHLQATIGNHLGTRWLSFRCISPHQIKCGDKANFMCIRNVWPRLPNGHRPDRAHHKRRSADSQWPTGIHWHSTAHTNSQKFKRTDEPKPNESRKRTPLLIASVEPHWTLCFNQHYVSGDFLWSPNVRLQQPCLEWLQWTTPMNGFNEWRQSSYFTAICSIVKKTKF